MTYPFTHAHTHARAHTQAHSLTRMHAHAHTHAHTRITMALRGNFTTVESQRRLRNDQKVLICSLYKAKPALV